MRSTLLELPAGNPGQRISPSRTAVERSHAHGFDQFTPRPSTPRPLSALPASLASEKTARRRWPRPHFLPGLSSFRSFSSAAHSMIDPHRGCRLTRFASIQDEVLRISAGFSKSSCSRSWHAFPRFSFYGDGSVRH